jgi:ABC-type Co2+ transport system permease subunit
MDGVVNELITPKILLSNILIGGILGALFGYIAYRLIQKYYYGKSANLLVSIISMAWGAIVLWAVPFLILLPLADAETWGIQKWSIKIFWIVSFIVLLLIERKLPSRRQR